MKNELEVPCTPVELYNNGGSPCDFSDVDETPVSESFGSAPTARETESLGESLGVEDGDKKEVSSTGSRDIDSSHVARATLGLKKSARSLSFL